MKVAVQGYNAGKAWLCICAGVEPPFSKSWIRHCISTLNVDTSCLMKFTSCLNLSLIMLHANNRIIIICVSYISLECTCS